MLSGTKRHLIAIGVGWVLANVLKVTLVFFVTGNTVFYVAHIIPTAVMASAGADGRVSGIEALHLSTWAFAAVTIPAMYWALDWLRMRRDRQQ